jgi:olefin beta-lactone synthetase
MSNVVLHILRNADVSGEKCAIVDCTNGINKFSYRELICDVQAFATKLKHFGYGKGDRIIVFIPMSYDTYVALLSVLCIGAVAVFLDAWVDNDRLLDTIMVTTPKAGIFSRDVVKKHTIPDGIRKIVYDIVKNDCCKDHTEWILPEEVGAEDDALFTFTTGSTGVPKAAKRTHGFFLIQHGVLSKYLDHQSNEINIVTFPIFLMSNLLSGITSIIPLFNPVEPSNVDCEWLNNNIQIFKATSLTGSTALLEKFSKYALMCSKKINITKIIIGGSPVFYAAADKFREAFPEADIRIIYGATEAVPISMNTVDMITLANSSYGLMVGKVIDEICVKILKPYDGPIQVTTTSQLDSYTLPCGEVGEIIVSGVHVLNEYVNNSEANQNSKIFDGERLWHRTGDAGALDNKNNLTFFGRVNHRFHIPGKPVIYPLQVEASLLNINNVKFAAVIHTGNKIIAFIELFEIEYGFKERMVNNAKASGFNFIDDYVIVDRIPRDPRHNSKADYLKLKKHVSSL